MPARRGAWAIYEVFQTAGEGQLFIGVTSDQQWTRFVEEFGLQALAADPRNVPFLTMRGRMGGSAVTAASINALARPGL